MEASVFLYLKFTICELFYYNIEFLLAFCLENCIITLFDFLNQKFSK